MMKETSMTEQQYRVIADRGKGDEPTITDIESDDLVTYIGGRGTVIRIERPVPTTAVWRDKHGDEWVEDAGGLMHSFETAPFPREHVEKKWGPLVPVGSHPSVPTREQIAEAIASAVDGMTEKAWQNASIDYRNEMLDGADAVLALIVGRPNA